MKNLIGMLLVVFGSSSAMALSVEQVSCTQGGEVALILVRGNDDTLRGQLRDAYNTADIECERGGWGPLTYQGPMVCVGKWSSSFAPNGSYLSRHVFINMKMESLEKVTAKYVVNWDARTTIQPNRNVQCQVKLAP